MVFHRIENHRAHSYQRQPSIAVPFESVAFLHLVEEGNQIKIINSSKI